MIFTVLALGLVDWIVTLIIVESEICRPIREWVGRQHDKAVLNWQNAKFVMDPSKKLQRRVVMWAKLRYFIGCHLCTGTWVGLLLAVITPFRPLGVGLLGILLAGFLYKAVGHLTLIVHKRLSYES